MSDHPASEAVFLTPRHLAAGIPVRPVKRVFDVLVACAFLLLLTPLYLLLALIIRCDTTGPAIFRQERVGRGGQRFKCLKFRTMRQDAEVILIAWRTERPDLLARCSSGHLKLADDPRITRVGFWLRRTSLDELPQLVNVFLGTMSLVGPRPIQPHEVADYGPSFVIYQQVRPGMTGLWQINGRSSTSFQARVAFDVTYVRSWSFWSDIVVLLRTVPVLFNRDNGAL